MVQVDGDKAKCDDQNISGGAEEHETYSVEYAEERDGDTMTVESCHRRPLVRVTREQSE